MGGKEDGKKALAAVSKQAQAASAGKNNPTGQGEESPSGDDGEHVRAEGSTSITGLNASVQGQPFRHREPSLSGAYPQVPFGPTMGLETVLQTFAQMMDKSNERYEQDRNAQAEDRRAQSEKEQRE